MPAPGTQWLAERWPPLLRAMGEGHGTAPRTTSLVHPLSRPPALLPLPRAACPPRAPACVAGEAVCSAMWTRSSDNMESARRGALQGLAEGAGGDAIGGRTGLWLPAVPVSGPVCSCQRVSDVQPAGCWPPLAAGTGQGRAGQEDKSQSAGRASGLLQAGPPCGDTRA